MREKKKNNTDCLEDVKIMLNNYKNTISSDKKLTSFPETAITVLKTHSNIKTTILPTVSKYMFHHIYLQWKSMYQEGGGGGCQLKFYLITIIVP